MQSQLLNNFKCPAVLAQFLGLIMGIVFLLLWILDLRSVFSVSRWVCFSCSFVLAALTLLHWKCLIKKVSAQVNPTTQRGANNVQEHTCSLSSPTLFNIVLVIMMVWPIVVLLVVSVLHFRDPTNIDSQCLHVIIEVITVAICIHIALFAVRIFFKLETLQLQSMTSAIVIIVVSLLLIKTFDPDPFSHFQWKMSTRLKHQHIRHQFSNYKKLSAMETLCSELDSSRLNILTGPHGAGKRTALYHCLRNKRNVIWLDTSLSVVDNMKMYDRPLSKLADEALMQLFESYLADERHTIVIQGIGTLLDTPLINQALVNTRKKLYVVCDADEYWSLNITLTNHNTLVLWKDYYSVKSLNKIGELRRSGVNNNVKLVGLDLHYLKNFDVIRPQLEASCYQFLQRVNTTMDDWIEEVTQLFVILEVLDIPRILAFETRKHYPYLTSLGLLLRRVDGIYGIQRIPYLRAICQLVGDREDFVSLCSNFEHCAPEIQQSVPRNNVIIRDDLRTLK
ncbi:hypothetical protein RCL1_009015 [Eukaryota sp. TZLM3-RCL]